MVGVIRKTGLFSTPAARAALALLWCGNLAFLAAMFAPGAYGAAVCRAADWTSSATLAPTAAYLLLQVALVVVFLHALGRVLPAGPRPQAA